MLRENINILKKSTKNCKKQKQIRNTAFWTSMYGYWCLLNWLRKKLLVLHKFLLSVEKECVHWDHFTRTKPEYFLGEKEVLYLTPLLLPPTPSRRPAWPIVRGGLMEWYGTWNSLGTVPVPISGVRKTLDGTRIDWNIHLRFTRNTLGSFWTRAEAVGNFLFLPKGTGTVQRDGSDRN